MSKFMKITLNGVGQRTETEGMSLVQNSYDNILVVYTPENFESIAVFFRRPDGQISPQLHMVSNGYDPTISGIDAVVSGYYAWTLPIPYSVTSFIMPAASAKLDVSLAMYYHNASGVQLSPRMANAAISVVRSNNSNVLDASYNATDVQNMWDAIGGCATDLADIKINYLKADQLVSTWSATPLNTNIPSEKLVKDSLDAKLDDSQLISSWASATADNIANANLVLAGLNSKINNSQLVTAWSATPLNANIASEKLVKDSLDAKA
jgi:hypothetical protein